MISSFKDWYLSLSQREKVLIGIFAALLFATIAFYGVFRPLTVGIDAAATRYQSAFERQARIEAKIAALNEPANMTGKPISGPLETVLSQSAGEEGFAVGKLDAQTDGTVVMVIDSAKPAALFSWLSKLEGRSVAVRELAVTSSENAVISANLTFRSVAKK